LGQALLVQAIEAQRRSEPSAAHAHQCRRHGCGTVCLAGARGRASRVGAGRRGGRHGRRGGRRGVAAGRGASGRRFRMRRRRPVLRRLGPARRVRQQPRVHEPPVQVVLPLVPAPVEAGTDAVADVGADVGAAAACDAACDAACEAACDAAYDAAFRRMHSLVGQQLQRQPDMLSDRIQMLPEDAELGRVLAVVHARLAARR